MTAESRESKVRTAARRRGRVLFSVIAMVAACATPARAAANDSLLKFEITFPASAHADAITGRVFVMISPEREPEPRLRAGFWGDAPPLFGADVDSLKPGQSAVIDGSTLGYPVDSLRDIPTGDYYVQALINIYTQFHRADGHTIWAHMDQWEGQQFNTSPGNLYSEVQQVHLDPASGYDVKLSLNKVIPPVAAVADTEWVKHVKIQSKLLTAFWGHPLYLGATVLLPKGYDAHPGVKYPVIYEQDHFRLEPAFNFSVQDDPAPPGERHFLKDYNLETGHQFYKAWDSDNFPRMIAVVFQHPTPYFDDSYAVNSANNGPYGDALLTELIPFLESHFRMIPEPWARVLTGGSTGGWESLALQVLHPDFFGGTWTLYPDPIDFRHYQLTNAYSDDNAFGEPGHHWLQAPRYMERRTTGQPETTCQKFSQLEDVLGSHGRSGQQLEAWEAVYGPVGDDGYPKPLWDKRTGKIDHTVAGYMRDHGYDLGYDLRANWKSTGPKLKGKIHIYVGDMDNFYLNLAVYDVGTFLESAQDPTYDGEIRYGRPEKGHGWQPATQEEMVRWMADHITRQAPAGTDTGAWKYN
ncbi:MAG TPA: alpha/beta hydrolase-fold protein [Terriglobia bacterium]|nr:alpha/beta hydrolase-fold protein [Terriglobia bacterium]